jgi:alpha-beta hydrolase superfamily lysophospholipase/SAM-dependent methyltransferase
LEIDMTSLDTAPRLGGELTETEHHFASHDGAELFYRAWIGSEKPTRAIVMFHRGHEHSGRLRELARALNVNGTAVFAWDARGHGKSPGERGYAENFGVVLHDIDCFMRHLRETYGFDEQQMIVLGHSVGAVAVAAWVQTYAPRIRAMVLATPALRVKLYVPFAIPGLRTRMLLGGKAFVKSYVKSSMLTADEAQAEAYDEDPLISRNIAVNILLDLFDISTRLLKDAGAIRTPTLILSSGNDWVVKNKAHQQFFERLGSSIKEHATFDGFKHAIFHEKHRAEPIAKVRQFIEKSFEAPAIDQGDLVHADQAGYARDEYQTLRRPLSWFNPKRINFAMQTMTLKTIARLSDGISLGWKTGFDSGESLDYVYENRSQGKLLLGKLIDRIYLQSIGWRGIRIRKQNLQTLLKKAIGELRARGEQVHLLDIACGGGRYTLEMLKAMERSDAQATSGPAPQPSPPGTGAREKERDPSALPATDITALLRDYSETALVVARQNAQKLGLTNVQFAAGDAFDRASVASVDPKPNLAMVSGLYELFPDNMRIRESLSGLREAIAAGGYLLYTNQPWHPQLEMIARVLINRDQQPWIMRRRTQMEMDELVRAAGFEKIEMLTDPWGIFTVSLARRIS